MTCCPSPRRWLSAFVLLLVVLMTKPIEATTPHASLIPQAYLPLVRELSLNGSWHPTGSMNTGRYRHTATLLPNGKVLVTGGLDSNYYCCDLASAELYDPASGTWTPTGSMTTAREYHTATLLPNGKVLVAGGLDPVGTYLASAELYDPATGRWTLTGSTTASLAYHTATLLANGMILVAGGFSCIPGSTCTNAGAQLYDPTKGTWTITGALNVPRTSHTATLLPNGMVLVVGGYDASAELYDPTSGTWTPTGSMTTSRVDHTATLLPDGKVLVTGGDGASIVFLSTADLYDPASGTWTSTNSMTTGRKDHTATLLPNGTVLVAGGTNTCDLMWCIPLASAEVYSPTLTEHP